MRLDWRQFLTFGELLSFAVAWTLGIAATLSDHAEQGRQATSANVAELDERLQQSNFVD